MLDPVRLAPAMATLVAQAPQPDTHGVRRRRIAWTSRRTRPNSAKGRTRSNCARATGRYMRRVDAKAGQRVEVTGALRPAFALVASTQTSLNADLRGAIERALRAAHVASWCSRRRPDKLDAALKAEKLPGDWLGYDANRRPFGVSAEVTPDHAPRSVCPNLSKAFDAQGIAAVTAPTAANRSRLVLTLLGAGIARAGRHRAESRSAGHGRQRGVRRSIVRSPFSRRPSGADRRRCGRCRRSRRRSRWTRTARPRRLACRWATSSCRPIRSRWPMRPRSRRSCRRARPISRLPLEREGQGRRRTEGGPEGA